MNKMQLAILAKKMGDRLVGSENKVNSTLAATVGGSGLIGAATVLLSLPEPNANILGGILILVGFIGAIYKESKSK